MDFESFVLAASTADLQDATDPAVQELADAVEFRLDLAPEPLSALEDYDGTLPVLATNRVEWEGGEAADDEARTETLARAVTHDAVEAVDVELEALDRGDLSGYRTHLHEHASVIVSVHDFERTPPESELCSLLERCLEFGDVGKLATTACDPADVLPLLGATRALSARGERVATMAMGESGRHSRAVAPLYGSVIGYAPVDPTEATAPGQYDLKTLATLVDRLREGAHG